MIARAILVLLFSFACLTLAPSCSREPSKPGTSPDSSTKAPLNAEPAQAAKSIAQVQDEQSKFLMAIPGVIGHGQGLCDGKPCLRVYVDKLTDELLAKIPKTIDGYAVVLVESGSVKAY
ncbi:MAG TPA: hypothetical protein VKU82_05395 [Planctomycetaceae bacterium]|nr:hypothetical protein [Planctomycetaceae bacterium]